ncbi:MAG TPA: hypothetical protein VNN80_31815 [Polyangiaceae bacterium]|nr:hypothetical protein [Polyangiaceae bacterium]
MPDAERRSIPARTLALYSAALGLVLAALAYVAYRELVHYERRAVRHVPERATLALRVDLEQVALFEPVRAHLLPLVERVPLGPGDSMATDRLARLRQTAGFNLGLDLRELVFASLDEGRAWVLVVGGLFPGGDLVGRIEAALETEPGAQVRREGSLLLLGPAALVLTRAADGVLLLASDAAAVEQALAPSEAYRALGVATEGAAALGIRAGWLEAGSASAPSGFSRVTGRLDLGDPFPLTLELAHAVPNPGPARQALERWLRVDTSALAPAADWGGERAVLARARFEEPPSRALTIAMTSWAPTELDRACRRLAVWLEARATSPGHSTRAGP